MIVDTRGTDVFDLTYDAAGRLTQVELNSTLEASYAYDAFGQRVFKDLAATLGAVHYHYDPHGRLLAESSATGVPEREYVWLPLDGQAWGLPLAMISDAGTAGPRLHYLHTDHLGTPLTMTSSGLASIEWSATFRPFGEVHGITGTDSLDLRFPGQLLDPETGFHQNWHRDYDPTLGRYLQSDPIGLEGGLNAYGYASQTPVNLADIDGRNPAAVAVVVGGAIRLAPHLARWGASSCSLHAQQRAQRLRRWRAAVPMKTPHRRCARYLIRPIHSCRIASRRSRRRERGAFRRASWARAGSRKSTNHVSRPRRPPKRLPRKQVQVSRSTIRHLPGAGRTTTLRTPRGGKFRAHTTSTNKSCQHPPKNRG